MKKLLRLNGQHSIRQRKKIKFKYKLKLCAPKKQHTREKNS
mgnify:CR=1 FL=1